MLVVAVDGGISAASAQEPQATTSAQPGPSAQTQSAKREKKQKQPREAGKTVFAPRPADPKAKMLVQANELVYDHQNERVSAVGQVQIYYDGAVLEADKVTHDRKADRLIAQGNVIYKSRDGKIIYTDQLELARDFRDGFVNSFLLETPEKTRFAATRADRSEGNVTVFQNGVYTACEPCKEDPKKPPLWQVKAARIIHNEKEKVITYENASMEFFGMPVAWFPYFWHPDPTVKRQSGFLAPQFFSSSRIGAGVEIPYFWALAPNYDVTFSVAPLTRQIGPLVRAEWRHRLLTGAYTIRAAGIFQQDKDAFIRGTPVPGLSNTMPGYRDFRGSLESAGEFAINKRWKWGWDGTLLTDKSFLTDYSIATTTSPGSERTNQLYLVGQGDRSYFDVRGVGFIGLSELDRSEELPIIHPVLDYSIISGKPVFGGELGFRMNFASLSRREGDYDPINSAAAVKNAAGFDSCDARAIMLGSTNPGNCLLRGMPGDYTRFSSELNWRRTLISAAGIIFKPFAMVRTDIASRHATDDSNSATAGTPSFIPTDRETLVRGMPTVGMEARWPFISVHSWGTQVVEPIAQFIVRPNETNIGRFPNEDAQSLVFDDANLFAIDKYSGYDRVEGGTRANVGVQYTANVHRLGMINILVGQSYHLFGQNSFAYGDIANTGLQSGLEHEVSDYVGRIYYHPSENFAYGARFRINKDNYDLSRIELEARSTFDKVSLSTIYARYDAQPAIGFLERREGIYQTATLKLHDNWSITGGIRYDLDRSRIDLGIIGLNFINECFATTFAYIADYTNIVDTRPVHKIMLRLNLRTVGGTGFTTHFGGDRTGSEGN
jgi:LPS-assembly protein